MKTKQISLSKEELAAAMAVVNRGQDALLLLAAAGADEPEAARQRLIAAGNSLQARGLAMTNDDQIMLGPELREIVTSLIDSRSILQLTKTGSEGADTLTLTHGPVGWLAQRSAGNWGMQCQFPLKQADLPEQMVKFLSPTSRTTSKASLAIPPALVNLDAKERRIPASLWATLGEAARSDPLAGPFVQAMVQARWRAAFQAFTPIGHEEISGYGVFFVQGPDDLWIIEGQGSHENPTIIAHPISVLHLKELFTQKLMELPETDHAQHEHK